MQLEEANEQLTLEMQKKEEIRTKLEISKKSLADEITLRNRNFINVYKLLSQYISDMTAFKKTVFNLITTEKVDKARGRNSLPR